MYIEFVRNLLLQCVASREHERLGELEAEREDRETCRRTRGKEERRGNEGGSNKKMGGRIERSGGGEKRDRE